MTPAFIGIDWGTTHRRAAVLSRDGELLAERVDEEGALACGGRFRASLESLLSGWPQAQGPLPVVMAGMVGAVAGWQHVPYLEGGTPLSALGGRLAAVADAPADRRWSIVPGYCLRGEGGAVDVMRGEETQLFGALHHLGLQAADGCYVLPGTHSKWVRLAQGRIVELRTYMSGELFALLGQHGTLASAMKGAAKGTVNDAMKSAAQTPTQAAAEGSTGETAGARENALKHEAVGTDPAFLRGVDDAAGGVALSHALFGARARIVTGGLAPESAAAYVSGLLIGAEWADAQGQASRDEPVRVIGEPALAALHAACAARHGRRLELLDAKQIQQAAWRALAQEEVRG